MAFSKVKFTEEARRERKRRAEAGDETSTLRYTPPAANAPPPPARPVLWHGDGDERMGILIRHEELYLSPTSGWWFGTWLL